MGDVSVSERCTKGPNSYVIKTLSSLHMTFRPYFTPLTPPFRGPFFSLTLVFPLERTITLSTSILTRSPKVREKLPTLRCHLSVTR